jgi:hypothetical protein
MALTPTEEAQYALNFGLSRSDLSLGAQIEYDRLIAEGYGIPPQQERPLTKEERKLAKQARREESARKRQEWSELAAATTWLPNLGVAIRDRNVYQHGVDQNGMHSDIRAMSQRAGRTEMKLLGPLAGHMRRSGAVRQGDAAAAGRLRLIPCSTLSRWDRSGCSPR